MSDPVTETAPPADPAPPPAPPVDDPLAEAPRDERRPSADEEREEVERAKAAGTIPADPGAPASSSGVGEGKAKGAPKAPEGAATGTPGTAPGAGLNRDGIRERLMGTAYREAREWAPDGKGDRVFTDRECEFMDLSDAQLEERYGAKGDAKGKADDLLRSVVSEKYRADAEKDPHKEAKRARKSLQTRKSNWAGRRSIAEIEGKAAKHKDAIADSAEKAPHRQPENWTGREGFDKFNMLLLYGVKSRKVPLYGRALWFDEEEIAALAPSMLEWMREDEQVAKYATQPIGKTLIVAAVASKVSVFWALHNEAKADRAAGRSAIEAEAAAAERLAQYEAKLAELKKGQATKAVSA